MYAVVELTNAVTAGDFDNSVLEIESEDKGEIDKDISSKF